MKRNVRLTIKYDGTRYYGWEHQPGEPMTIQGKLENVTKKMLDLPGDEIPQIIGAGRTDAGVHAQAMVANFIADTEMSETEILKYMNRYLPDDISVDEVRFAAPRFHSRYNAIGKIYRYTVWAGDAKPVFRRKYMTVLDDHPDVERMNEAAKYLIGTHDFKSFCANPRMKKSTVRTISDINIREKGAEIRMTFHGNGFLQNMVRIFVGTLLEVGFGRMEPARVQEILEGGDRREAGPTAPPQGLCLMRVEY